MYTIKPTILCFVFSLGFFFAKSQVPNLDKSGKDSGFIRADSLKAAVVTALMRPHIKGDTIEYNTEHIKLEPNAVVEEMLKRLPGLRVDANGKITYNGEKIDHLLVDGEDIFGSTPSLVTQNFDASKIARVQILDRKSQESTFTGVDDGTRTKTLNLVLTESARNGCFGKVEAGGDKDGYYLTNGVLAEFQKKEQFTALVLASNTGTTNFRSGAGAMTDIVFLNAGSDVLGASAGTGIPRYDALSLHYANTWPNENQHLLSNYQYSHNFTQPITNTQTTQIQSDSIYGTRQQSQSTNQQDQHWISGIYDCTPNSRSALELTYVVSDSKSSNQYAAGVSSQFNDTLVNASRRTIRDNVTAQLFGIGLKWRTVIGKQPGRIFAVTGNIDKHNALTEGYLYSLSDFYQPNGSLESSDTVDQRKRISSGMLAIKGSVSFSNPMWKGSSLNFIYTISSITDGPLQATYAWGDGKYQQIVDSLSSHLKEETNNQSILISLRGSTGKLKYYLNEDFADYRYDQKDLLFDSVAHIHHLSQAPRVMLNYAIDQTSNINFNYSSTIQQPNLSQLSPIINNSDPLHITEGNPSLRPSATQSFEFDFRHFTAWILNFALNMNFSNGAISTKTITDSLGRQISQPVNVNGGKAIGMNLSLDSKIVGVDVGFDVSGNYSRTMTYINADLSQNDSYTGTGGFKLNKYVNKKVNLQLTTNFSYLWQQSDVNRNVILHYWTQSHQASVTLYIIPHFEINTSGNYTWQEKSSNFAANTSTLFWNASLSRNFLNNRVSVRFQLNNILNQSSGITRSSANNLATQTITNILGRYWMFSAAYHFDKKFRRK